MNSFFILYKKFSQIRWIFFFCLSSPLPKALLSPSNSQRKPRNKSKFIYLQFINIKLYRNFNKFKFKNGYRVIF